MVCGSMDAEWWNFGVDSNELLRKRLGKTLSDRYRANSARLSCRKFLSQFAAEDYSPAGSLVGFRKLGLKKD